jgi:DNA polymerase elongation subunit (family B)/predicted RNA-binding Zn-ribbon protein involved in translation (DUF1610 family)
MKPKILFCDIETFPNKSYTWGKWEQDVMEFIDQWYILSIGYKWLGGATKVMALPDFKGYKPYSKDEKLVKFIWDLFNEADIIIAQNGDNFDIKKINTRFLIHGLPPPAPYKTIDTLKVARSKFSFNSNKLDDLGRDLGIGRKVEHEGFPLWLKCEKGDLKAWKRMKRYNKQDVDLLAELYEKELPYITNHPNLDAYYKGIVCPKCGSNDINWRGIARSKVSIYKRFQCQSCGGWGRFNQANKVSNVSSL